MNGDKYNIVLPEFKYYNGEDNDKCPYSSDDVRSHFWWGEMMFSQLRDLDVKFEEYEKTKIRTVTKKQKHNLNINNEADIANFEFSD